MRSTSISCAASPCARRQSAELVIYRPAAGQPQLPLHLDGASGERDRRPLQQHRGLRPRAAHHALRPGGKRHHAFARSVRDSGRTAGGSDARPHGPQARDDRERLDSCRRRRRVHPHHPPFESLAAIRAERPADVRLAVFHQRTLFHSAHHRQPRRAAHSQFRDADYAVGHPGGGHAARRRGGATVRLPLGLRAQLALVSFFGVLAFRGCARRPARSAPREPRSRRPKWSGPGTNTPRACATCARPR